MRRIPSITILTALALTLTLVWAATTTAKKPESEGGSAEYTIIDLPGPYHQADGGWSRTFAERISDARSSGTVYVLGRDGQGSEALPCLWTIDTGNVSVQDLAALIDVAEDVNSSGIIGGLKDDRPVLLLADDTPVNLEDASLTGRVRALNNPDGSGNFQAIGYTTASGTSYTPVLWDVNVDGTVCLSTSLIDSSGLPFYASDISDLGIMGGWVVIDGEQVPAIAAFDQQGLQISLRPNPNPAEITNFSRCHVDEASNLLGDGFQVVSYYGYPRAVIWPDSGRAIDLTAETGNTTTGADIALVDKVMQAVGRAERDGRGAFAYLYTAGSFKNLGPMSKGDQPWTLDRAEGINTSGAICGTGTVGSRKDRQLHGFVLLPTTEN